MSRAETGDSGEKKITYFGYNLCVCHLFSYCVFWTGDALRSFSSYASAQINMGTVHIIWKLQARNIAIGLSFYVLFCKEGLCMCGENSEGWHTGEPWGFVLSFIIPGLTGFPRTVPLVGGRTVGFPPSGALQLLMFFFWRC